ncbi:MAG: indole-3-glycerol-phosphate synthase, partial [Thermoleophilia bacterium]|nr:indole-3-glycerol-phosphate synthase [Thermoleophilia bacterium]
TPLGRPEARAGRDRLRAALSAPGVAARARGALAPLAVIAEVKRRSPSRGAIAPLLEAPTLARDYAAAGADAISVLTEPDRFGGSMDDLRAVVKAVDAPVLRKDFIVDRYQVWEAAEAGAAGVLLIAAALPSDSLGVLLGECHHCGLDALVEVHDADDLERAHAVGAALVGVNNRDLRTLEVDLAVSEALGPLVDQGALFVSESGIGSPAQARRARAAGAQAVLVGEALVRAPRENLASTIAGLRALPAAEGGAA